MQSLSGVMRQIKINVCEWCHVRPVYRIARGSTGGGMVHTIAGALVIGDALMNVNALYK